MPKKSGKVKEPVVQAAEQTAEQAAPAVDEKKKGFFLNGVSQKNILPVQVNGTDMQSIRVYLPHDPEVRAKFGMDENTKSNSVSFMVRDKCVRPATERGTNAVIEGYYNVRMCDLGREGEPLINCSFPKNEKTADGKTEYQHTKMAAADVKKAFEANKGEYKDREKSVEDIAVENEAAVEAPSPV